MKKLCVLMIVLSILLTTNSWAINCEERLDDCTDTIETMFVGHTNYKREAELAIAGLKEENAKIVRQNTWLKIETTATRIIVIIGALFILAK